MSKAASKVLDVTFYAMSAQPIADTIFSRPKLERRMTDFLNSFERGSLRNCGSPEEAQARVAAFAYGVDTYYSHDLESQGISYDSWGESLINVLNGVDDGQFIEVMENIGDGDN